MPEFELLIIYPAYAERDVPDSGSYSAQKPGINGLVTSCTIGANKIEFHRIFTNTPRASGGHCAGAAWSQYELRTDGKTVASFHIGCIDALVRAYYGVLSICIDGDDTCRVRHWDQLKEQPLRSSLLGKWNDAP